MALDLEARLEDSKTFREQRLDQAKTEMQQLLIKHHESSARWTKHETTYETFICEISMLKQEIKSVNEEIAAAEQNLIELKEKFAEIKNEEYAHEVSKRTFLSSNFIIFLSRRKQRTCREK